MLNSVQSFQGSVNDAQAKTAACSKPSDVTAIRVPVEAFFMPTVMRIAPNADWATFRWLWLAGDRLLVRERTFCAGWAFVGRSQLEQGT